LSKTTILNKLLQQKSQAPDTSRSSRADRQVIIFADVCKKIFMSNPFVQAFFVGRAVAEIFNEQLENTLTDTLSELGKLDAELRERMRQFSEEVMERANREMEVTTRGRTSTTIFTPDTQPVDTQAMIDDLRAEIALLRTEIQRYRSSSSTNN